MEFLYFWIIGYGKPLRTKNLMEPVYKAIDWDCHYEYRKERFSNKLFFIASVSKLSFDYRSEVGNGIMVSKEFLEFLKKNTNDFSFTLLEVYSNKMKTITKKEYFYVKFNSYLIDGFDYEKSEYEKNMADDGTIMLMNNHPWITTVKKLNLIKKL
jgi:hypothetical protein